MGQASSCRSARFSVSLGQNYLVADGRSFVPRVTVSEKGRILLLSGRSSRRRGCSYKYLGEACSPLPFPEDAFLFTGGLGLIESPASVAHLQKDGLAISDFLLLFSPPELLVLRFSPFF